MVKKVPDRPTKTIRNTNDQFLKIAHRRQRMRKAIHLSGSSFLSQEDEVTELGARVLNPDILDQAPTSRTREEGFREREMVLWLVEEDGFVQDRVGERIQPPRDEAHGEEVVLRGQG